MEWSEEENGKEFRHQKLLNRLLIMMMQLHAFCTLSRQDTACEHVYHAHIQQ